MTSTMTVMANKSTTSLYLLSRIVKLDYVKLLCLYQVYHEDVFYLFHILEGDEIQFSSGVNKDIPTERDLEKLFSRAIIILDALKGYERRIRRYDMKYYRELEKLYKNGLYIVEVKDE